MSRKCGYKDPSSGSLRKLLIYLGLSKDLEPSEEQRIKFITDCVREMINVKEYLYQGVLTPAHVISAESENPNFAALLVNEIVSYYFEIEKENLERSYKKRSDFLVGSIIDAQKSLKSAEQRYTNFTIENADMLVGADTTLDKNSLKSSIKEKIFSLGQAELVEDNLSLVLQKLESLKGARFQDIKTFVDSVGIVGGLSSKFVAEISQVDSTSKKLIDLNMFMNNQIRMELSRLKRLVERNKFSRQERQSELSYLLQIDKQLTDFEIDIESKQMYLLGLEARLTSADFEAGLERLREGQVHTEAIPPLFPISPNKKLILAASILVALLFGILAAIFRQAIKQNIYSLTQLNKLQSLENKFYISLKTNSALFGFKQGLEKTSPFSLQFHSSFNQKSEY